MEKKKINQAIELIETLFEKAKSNDEYSEMELLRRKHRIIKTEGLDIKKLMGEGGSELVVKSIRSFLARTETETRLLLKKGIIGLPLTEEEKVELLTYRHALQWLGVFGREE